MVYSGVPTGKQKTVCRLFASRPSRWPGQDQRLFRLYSRSDLTGSIPGGGQYSVYRASGFSEGTGGSSVEKVWTVSANGGERLGFRWAYPKNQRWDTAQPPHLIAFAGSQSRDLGPFRDRNVKYVWAGNNGDVVGYFNSENGKSTGRMLTMQ